MSSTSPRPAHADPSTTQSNPSPPSPAAPWLAAAACLLFSLLYLPALTSFFSNDDWALVYYYGKIDPVHFWEYFSPKVVWFYRPLQALQFGVLYRVFGLNELPGNLSLLAMHLGVCALAFLLLREVTRRPLLAAGAVAIFSGLWLYVDILLWKANFNTLQWALLTLAACFTFARHLQTRDARWFYLANACCLGNLFTKESAMSLPILFLMLWACIELRASDLAKPNLVKSVGRVLRLLAPSVGIVAVYIVLHVLFIEDIYSKVLKPDYSFVGPVQGLRQVLASYNHVLLSFHADPVLLPELPWLQRAVHSFASDSWAVPVNLGLVAGPLGALAWRRKDRTLAFGLAWICLSFVPMVFLKSYHQSRFYYLPALGAALIVAHLVSLVWQYADRLAQGPRSGLRVAIAAAVVYLALANGATTLRLVMEDRDASNQARSVYQLLAAQRGQLEPGCLVVMRNAPVTFFNNGLGAPEMARLALNDPSADAVVDGQKMEPARVTQLHAIRNVYVVDLAEEQPKLRRVPDARTEQSKAQDSAHQKSIKTAL